MFFKVFYKKHVVKNTKEREISLKNKKLMRGILKDKAPNVAGNVSSSVLL